MSNRLRLRNAHALPMPEYAENCAFLRETRCEACTYLECAKSEKKCPFFKTREQAKADLASAVKRGGFTNSRDYAEALNKIGKAGSK